MKKKKASFSGKRNLIVLGTLVLVIASLAVGVRFFQSDPVFIVVSGPEALEALRQSEDNAYNDLTKAVEAANRIEGDALSAANALRLEIIYRPGNPAALNSVLAEAWSNPDHGIWQYAVQGEEAAQLAATALVKPYYLHLYPIGFFEARAENDTFLAVLLLGRGLWQLEAGNIEEGVAHLLDGLKLATFIAPYERYRSGFAAYARQLLAEILIWAQKSDDADAIALVQARLSEARAYPTRCEMLESSWMRIDESMPGLAPITEASHGMGRRVGMRFFMNQVQRSARFIREHEEALRERCAGAPGELGDYVQANRPRTRFNRGGSFVLDRMVARIYETGEWGAQYEATIAGLALERYHHAHDAYPDNLEALVPAYLEALPPDPYNGGVLRYQLREEDYIVYSLGRDDSEAGDNTGHHLMLIAADAAAEARSSGRRRSRTP